MQSSATEDCVNRSEQQEEKSTFWRLWKDDVHKWLDVEKQLMQPTTFTENSKCWPLTLQVYKAARARAEAELDSL